MGKLSSLSCLRLSFSFFSTLTFSVGCGIVALGIFVILGGLRETDLPAQPKSELVSAFAVCLITAGSCAGVISFLGCCGAATSSRPLLLGYAALLASIVAAQLTLLCLGAFFRQDIDNFLRREITRDVISRAKANEKVYAAWGRVQVQLKCCGVLGPNDWLNNAYFPQITSDDAAEDSSNLSTIPDTCCQQYYGQCDIENAHQNGCYDTLSKILFQDRFHILMTIGLVLIGVEALALLIVIVLIRMLAHRLASATSRAFRRTSDDETVALTGSQKALNNNRRPDNLYLNSSNSAENGALMGNQQRF